MSEAMSCPPIWLSACAGAVFNGTDTLVMVGCPHCVGVAPVTGGVMGEHNGRSGIKCSYAGARVIDDLFGSQGSTGGMAYVDR